MVFRVRTVTLVACLALSAAAAELPGKSPLLPPRGDWRLGSTWQPAKRIGESDFHFCAQGPWVHYTPEGVANLRQVGLLGRVIPGLYNLKYFDPETKAKEPPGFVAIADQYLQHRWPLATIEYCVARGNPPPKPEVVELVKDFWIGDSMPEAPIYRLEPVFHYLKTGEIWQGSSMGYVDKESLTAFFRDQLCPRLDKALPFYRDPQHQWTRPELRLLCDLYCEEFFRKVGKPIAWGMFVSPHHLASLPRTTAVGEKAGDAFALARGRGISRQNGGGKFLYCWRGHEPTERYFYPERGWYSINREEWGYPLPHLWYYLFRPFLAGANMYVNEGMPASLYQDIEGDGQLEMSTLGHLARALLDYADRHPDRGVVYTPVGLLMDYDRGWPSNYHSGGTTYFGYGIPYDDADHMNHGLLCDLLFPEHRDVAPSGTYSRTAPYGEIFDLLAPNRTGNAIDPRIFDGYQVLIALGGQTIAADYAKVLKDYVRAGGTLVIDVKDLGPHLEPAFFGVTMTGQVLTATSVTFTGDGSTFTEAPFDYQALTLTGAEALYTADGKPLVTRHRVGQGTAILITAHHLIQKEAVESRQGMLGRAWTKKPLLTFVADFIERLTTGLGPIEVRCRPEDREDLSWQIARVGDGWTVTMFDYSLRRETLVAQPLGTAKVIADYPYREVPFEIVCRAPVADVMERYGERDVNWRPADGGAVIAETMRAGDIRVYELQPKPIPATRFKRPINYAENRPVTASSTLKGFAARAAVDGRLDNDDFWQSDLDQQKHYVFDLPQWLQVELEAPKLIDHVYVQFHTWPHQSLETRLRVYKYLVEASADGQTWTTVIDERVNEDPAKTEGLERWFDPLTARYVKLTVLRNSAFAGAQVVELKVMGPETELATLPRQSIKPRWQADFPPEVADAPADKLRYLITLKPLVAKPGWMPAGATWEKLNGWVRLYVDFSLTGAELTRSLYAQTVSEFTYAVPPGARWFAAACGLGNRDRIASVEFKVAVDGVEKYTSGIYRFGERVLPVVVDVRGAKELTLRVTDGGDGIINDYAWWGDARFVLD